MPRRSPMSPRAASPRSILRASSRKVSLWRVGRGWPERVLRGYLATLADRSVNFAEPFDELTAERGWTLDGASATIGREPPGPPVEHGHFARARQALIQYDFSDPRIVTGHFDPRAP